MVIKMYYVAFEFMSALIKAAIIILIIIYLKKIFSGKKTANSSFPNQKTRQKDTPSRQFTSSDYSKTKKTEYFDWDKPKRRSISDIFKRNKEVDCDLDERVFGPKNQHKDLF